MQLLLTLLLVILFGSFGQAQELAPGLRSALDRLSPGEEISVIVTLADQVDLEPFRDKARAAGRMGREERGRHRAGLVRALREKAEKSQGPVNDFLRGRGARRAESLWIINALAVTADRRTVEALAARPEVAEVRLDQTIPLPRVDKAQTAAAEWNIAAVRAPELWSRGFTGQGVVVAIMDSGVDPFHPDLGPRWRGGGNSWFNAYADECAKPGVTCTACDQNRTTPCDGDGHGTAVMGVLVGGEAGGTAIGVAPGAQWIAVKVFPDPTPASPNPTAPVSAIHRGFQWLLDPDGNPATGDAPDVVNNSWGFDPGLCLPEFRGDVQALKAAGISVVFAAGNGGPDPATSISPANYPEAVAVGAVDQALTVPFFSARGPSACDGSLYPELVAPGVFVRTADRTLGGVFPNSYATVSGTSFSAPHVAGGVALLLSALPERSVATLETALQQTALDLGPAGPDNSYGSGLVDVLAAYVFLAPPAANIAVLPSATFFSFGTVGLTASVTQTFTVSNAGPVDLVLGPIGITGPNVGEFSLQSDTCSGRTLAAATGCTFDVTFAPTTPGRKTATVAIPSNDPDTPVVGIELVGNDLARIGTFRRGTWFLDDASGGWDPLLDLVVENFGAPADLPVAGDMNGDGISEIGVYRPATGEWFFDADHSRSWSGCGLDLCLAQFGAPADLPVAGDMNGDGRDEVGVFRPATGQWFFDRNGNGLWDGCGVDLCSAQFGAVGDLPVVGDVDGDGVDEVGVFRPATGGWFFDLASDGWSLCQAGGGSDLCLAQFGAAGDLPVVGDWDGDGRAEVGTFRQGRWFLDDGDGVWSPALDRVIADFGAPGDLPVAGRWSN